MVSVVVFGSREFDDFVLLKKELIKQFELKGLEPQDVTIIEGGARGADRLARRFAEQSGVSFLTVNADWDEYGKSAGHIRNNEMAKLCDWGIGFWDGKSKGTKGMIDRMKKLEKEVIVIEL